MEAVRAAESKIYTDCLNVLNIYHELPQQGQRHRRVLHIQRVSLCSRIGFKFSLQRSLKRRYDANQIHRIPATIIVYLTDEL